jgi:protein involved in polysaccharide export with SLBB domain
MILALSLHDAVASDEEYRIKPGDTLYIFVLEHEEYNQTLPVRADGKISYFFGDIQAAGLTVRELSEKIRGMLRSIRAIKEPVVLITVRPMGNELFIFGAVRMPNRYTFRTDRISILKALAMAGGYEEEKADLKSTLVIRSNGGMERFDLKRMLAGEVEEAYLEPGDSLYVPEMGQVRVTGYVIQPGMYRVGASVSVASALAMAGGPTQGEANLRKVVIFRADGSEEEIDITDEFWSGSSPELFPGDTLYVPSAYRYDEVNVLGYVRNPGAYRVKRGVTILEAMALAGGALENADLKDARIIRPDGTTVRVDIKELYRKPSMELKLYPGDTLYVPKGFEVNWSLVLTVLSVISTVVSLTR